MVTTLVLIKYIGADGRVIGDRSLGLEDLSELTTALERLTDRPHGTIRILIDIALPALTYPCNWSVRARGTGPGTPCGAPSVITKSLATIIGTDHVGTPQEQTRVGPWRDKDLCSEHYTEAQAYRDRGTLLMRNPQ